MSNRPQAGGYNILKSPRSTSACSMIALNSSLLKQDTLDELWNNRGDRDLHVPLLTGDPWMHRHVLHRELNFDRQPPQLHHLGQAEADGDRPDVLRRRVPIRQDVTRVSEAPALAEKDRRDRLQVHLVRVGPAVHAAN